MVNQKLHPVHEVNSGTFNTTSKKIISLDEVNLWDIEAWDIITGLCNICRFGGQTREFYSVAHHTMYVAALAPERLKKAALLHDASEAYLGDVIKPLKVRLGKVYEEIEERFMRVIFQKYDVDYSMLAEIKPYDKKALEDEFKWFFEGNHSSMNRYWFNVHRKPYNLFSPLDMWKLLSKTFDQYGIK